MFLGENKHYSHTMKYNIVVKINVSIHILTWINLEIETLSLNCQLNLSCILSLIGRPHVMHFIVLYRYCIFYRLKVCLTQVCQSQFFNNICSVHLSVTFWSFSQYFKLFFVIIVC